MKFFKDMVKVHLDLRNSEQLYVERQIGGWKKKEHCEIKFDEFSCLAVLVALVN